jgi:hypothetical protein
MEENKLAIIKRWVPIVIVFVVFFVAASTDIATFKGSGAEEIMYEETSVGPAAFTDSEFDNAGRIPVFNDIEGRVIGGENGNIIVLKAEDFSENIAQLSASVGELLGNSTVSHVVVLFPEDERAPAKKTVPVAANIPGAANEPASIIPYVKNVQSISYTIGTTVMAVVSGSPDVTMSINPIRNVANTFSASFGATTAVISASVGWNVTGATPVSIEGSFTVPATNKGNKVKKGYLRARTLYKRKTYDVYVLNMKRGTGTATKPIGIDFTASVSY